MSRNSESIPISLALALAFAIAATNAAAIRATSSGPSGDYLTIARGVKFLRFQQERYSMSGMMRSPDLNAEGVAHALQLTGEELRLTIATPDQLNVAAAFLAKALARFSKARDLRTADAIGRLEGAGKIIGAELPRRSTDQRRRN